MAQYRISYIVTAPDSVDPCSLLDGAEAAADTLTSFLEGEAHTEDGAIEVVSGFAEVEPWPRKRSAGFKAFPGGK